MFLFLHKLPFRAIVLAIFFFLILLPSAWAQQWGIVDGTIVSGDEHKFSIRNQTSFLWCPDCPRFKDGDIIEFKFPTNGSARIMFNQYNIPPARVSDFRGFDSLLFHKQGKDLFADDVSLKDPKPGVLEAIEKNEPPPQPSPLAAALAAQKHVANGLALQKKGDVDGAVREYREAIKLYPYSAQPHNNLGNALRSRGDHDGALSEYKEALRLDPFYKTANYNLAIELKARGETKQAAQNFLAACPTYPSAYCPASPDERDPPGKYSCADPPPCEVLIGPRRADDNILGWEWRYNNRCSTARGKWLDRNGCT